MSYNLHALFQKGIEKHFLIELKEWSPAWKKIFHVTTTKSRYVDHQAWESYGLPGYRQPGERVKFDSFKPSFSKRYIMRSYGLGDAIAREDMEDDLYGVVHRILPAKGGGMARSFRTLMEKETASFFATQGYASGTGVAGMSDGVSLFNTAHPVSVSQPSVTVANRPSSDVDLSIASVQAAITNLRTQKMPNNQDYIDNRPRICVVNPVNSFIAQQIFKQTMERGTADNNTNYISRYKVDVVEWPHLEVTGATSAANSNNGWFMVGEEHFLNFYLRSAYQVDTMFDVNTKSLIVTTDARFDYGASDWRGTYGSKGL